MKFINNFTEAFSMQKNNVFLLKFPENTTVLNAAYLILSEIRKITSK